MLQPFVDSKEDQNSVGECPASQEKITAMQQKVSAWLQPGRPGHDIFRTDAPAPLRMCVLDGFLLYAPPRLAPAMALLDVKLFLQVSRARATRRRAARDGYVTLEGFWRDPPGYVDKVVWPNYVEAHRWMFAGGDVEGGRLAWEVLRERGILAQDGGAGGQGQGEGEGEGGSGTTTTTTTTVDFDFEQTFEWVVDAVMESLEAWYRKAKAKAASSEGA